MALLKKLNLSPAKTSERILFEKALASLSDDEDEEWDERAAIMESHGNKSREEAERFALEIILERRHQQ